MRNPPTERPGYRDWSVSQVASYVSPSRRTIDQASEVGPHLLQRDAEVVDDPPLVLVALGVVGHREALEGVGHPHGAIVLTERVERGAHQDRSTAPPGTRLDQVSFDAVANHGLDA
jgi:hypothetical protein